MCRLAILTDTLPMRAATASRLNTLANLLQELTTIDVDRLTLQPPLEGKQFTSQRESRTASPGETTAESHFQASPLPCPEFEEAFVQATADDPARARLATRLARIQGRPGAVSANRATGSLSVEGVWKLNRRKIDPAYRKDR